MHASVAESWDILKRFCPKLIPVPPRRYPCDNETREQSERISSFPGPSHKSNYLIAFVGGSDLWEGPGNEAK